VSGACLALGFPRYGHPAFAWIALVPLLVALTGWTGRPGPVPGQPPLRAFTLGLLAGLVYFVGTVYWTGAVVVTFGGLPAPVALVAVILLASYLALYPALAALVVTHLVRAHGVSGVFVAPAAWTGAELIRGHLFGGFPWVPLGNSQVTVLPVAQLASVFGVYGLSAVVAGVNALLAYAVLSTGRRRGLAAAGAILLPLAIAAWGTVRIADGAWTRAGTPVQVGLVQANIAQNDKWDPTQARRIFTTYLAMTRDVARRGATYVIWPESSLPFRFEDHAEGKAAVEGLARELGIHLLFGSDQLVGGDTSYNAAFQLAPDGRTLAIYRKIHLVPFGEFIPVADWLTFFPPLVETLGGFAPFAPGDSMVMLPLGEHVTSTAICYEVVYPSLVARAVRDGSELLTTITNDAWYGQSSAPFQHFEMAAMRAIEQGRYLARAANTGISGIVDPYGRVVARSGLFEQAGLVEEVRLLQSRTIYSSIGDALAYAAIGLTVLALLMTRRTTHRHRVSFPRVFTRKWK
jgi:apolipoprotein N-acyltransferase